MSDAKNIIEKTEVLQEELSELETQFNDVSEKLAVAEKRIEEYESKISEVNAELECASEENEKLLSQNDDLSKQVEQLTEEEATVEVKVMEELQEIGVQPVSLSVAESDIDYVAEFQSITDPVAKTKYYRKHKEQILGGNK